MYSKNRQLAEQAAIRSGSLLNRQQNMQQAADLSSSFSSAVYVQGDRYHLAARFTVLTQQGYELLPALAPHYLPQTVCPPRKRLLSFCTPDPAF